MIRLSPKHGLNPSIGICFFCGEDDGTIVLPGRLKDDQQAPRRTCWSHKPCLKCKKWMRQGIILVSVCDGETGNNPHRTGGWVVVTEETVKRWFNEPLLTTVLKTRFAFVYDQTWDAAGLPREKSMKEV